MSTEMKPCRNPEAESLVREMAAAFGAMACLYRDHFHLDERAARAKAAEPDAPEYVEQILRGPPDQVSWLDLSRLTERDPELAARRWEEIQRAALDELRSGHRIARTLEGLDSSPWQRARFLALRHDLMEQWQPRSGVERQLIEALAVAQAGFFHWLDILTVRSSINAREEARDAREQGHWRPPRCAEKEAVDQAAGMVDRFNRIFLRTLRALRDLRRYGSAVVVQNATQVNVGGQQVNVAAVGRGEA